MVGKLLHYRQCHNAVLYKDVDFGVYEIIWVVLGVFCGAKIGCKHFIECVIEQGSIYISKL